MPIKLDVAVITKSQPRMETYEKIQHKSSTSLQENRTLSKTLRNILATQRSFFKSICQCRSLNIAIVGASSSGKTSIVRRYAGDLFYPTKTQPLSEIFRTSMAIEKDHLTSQTKLYDVTITESCRDVSQGSAYNKTLRSSNAFLIVYSMDDFDSVIEMTKILTDLYLLNKNKCPIVVAGNKADLSGTTLDKTDLEKHLEFSGYHLFRGSAKNNENILELFLELAYIHAGFESEPS